ncbi:malto-oligosyltrehalose synthase [Niastella yeongjuensis]|uniref:Malto-oligosyltrehalose synthase n=1 Tax=Niastella yeongjuensis TaxID=354355 RepID=A0A1V9EJP4_9BACT|nr:malto-oligosyltrehalose synthase [Niastella yeongjuensis]OQP46272.1 malto-oligosyltrehalose synthase [Niastella yeongjuensis]SEP46330.1 maltooligosyl trehalose synthase [Niastella yeongjuensis]
MIIPVSTYRLQLNASFNFNDVEKIINYLHELGITTIYASPFFTAPAGSTHGYDVGDPYTLNPEIGTMDQLQRINIELRQKDMTWLQDVVPNHMVFGMSNFRLADVLERGEYSLYYKWFDIDWNHPDPMLNGKVMVPFLGKPLPECLQQREIKIALLSEGFVVKYGETIYPLSISAYEPLLALLHQPDVVQLIQQLRKEAAQGWPLSSWREIKTGLVQTFLASEQAVTEVRKLLEVINSDARVLQNLLQQQCYQLCYWRDANQVINYRRFFAVNELIAVNIANEEVFYEYHQLLHNLYRQKLVQGVRIDHIDGLEKPLEYLNRVRQFFGDDCYVVVEKILEQHEQLPANWPVQGTTGYEFTAQISWLLTNTEGARQLKYYYQTLFPATPDYKTIVFEKKRHFLETYMVGEWNNLVRLLYTLQLVPATVKPEEVKQALALLMCCMPVYRLYPGEEAPDSKALQIIDQTIQEAITRGSEWRELLQLLQTIWDFDENDTAVNLRRLEFQKRLMQFTGPLMAKGVEDTSFYVYNALLGHNEVGDTPNKEAYAVQNFHHWMEQRQQQFPFSINATSTHDTKRGEDGRLRVHALTWFAEEWQQAVEHWRMINAPGPALEDEYFIYQSLIAGFPTDEQVTPEYTERLKAYYIKSIREAKLFTNWQQPNSQYEEAGCLFIEKLLSPRHDFLKNFLPFVKKIVAHAQLLSLTQTLVKITAPGVSDIYQGSEGWNTSYVDPDNRRPVDFDVYKQYVMELREKDLKGFEEVLKYVTTKRDEGLEKFYVTLKALQCRRQLAAVFLHGEYIPVYATNGCGIIAYARHYKKEWVLVIAPVSGKETYNNCSITLPANAPVKWQNNFTGEMVDTAGDLPIHNLFSNFPVLLLTGEV